MPSNNDGELYFDEASEISWNNYLSTFKKEVLPILLKAGYSQDTALVVWLLNKNFNLLGDVLDEIHELKEEMKEGL